MMKHSYLTVSRVVFLSFTMGLACAAHSQDVPAGSNMRPSSRQATSAESFHLFAIGDIPLDGGYDQRLGLKKICDKEECKDKSSPFLDKELRELWGLSSSKPLEVDGLSWSGRPLRIRVTGTKPNEFGPLFNIAVVGGTKEVKTETKGPPIFWSGHLNVKVLPPVGVNFSSPDSLIITQECITRGLEMKHNTDRTIWYLDPLSANERLDIADPMTKGNIDIKAFAPLPDINAIIATCWYRSASNPGTKRYRGPSFAYDLSKHAVIWRRAVDLDEHFTFISIGKGEHPSIYMLEYTYNDAGETFGYKISSFAFQFRNEPYILHDGTGISIGRHLSWFPGEK